jgi:hypothetical protein
MEESKIISEVEVKSQAWPSGSAPKSKSSAHQIMMQHI